MACVYQHIREDNDNPMYIGISKHNFKGIDLSGKKSNHRACLFDETRNKMHKNYIKKYGVKVEILHNNISVKKAKELEIFYIKKYGRIDLKTGILVNMTDGGDGGFNPSVETRWKLGAGNRGRKWNHSEDSKKKMSEVRIGMKLSDEHKKNIGLKSKGRHWNLTKEQKENRNEFNKNKGYIRTKLNMCPYCNTNGANTLLKRYHFDNCFLLKMGLKTKNDLIKFVNDKKFKNKAEIKNKYLNVYKFLKNNNLFNLIKFHQKTFYKKAICPYCKMQGNLNNLKANHYDKCILVETKTFSIENFIEYCKTFNFSSWNKMLIENKEMNKIARFAKKLNIVDKIFNKKD